MIARREELNALEGNVVVNYSREAKKRRNASSRSRRFTRKIHRSVQRRRRRMKKRERTKRRNARSPSSPTLLLLHRCLIIDARARARKRKRRPSGGARRRFVTATEPKERLAFPPARSTTPLSLSSCASPRRVSGRAAARRALHCPFPLPSRHVCVIPIPLYTRFNASSSLLFSSLVFLSLCIDAFEKRRKKGGGEEKISLIKMTTSSPSPLATC